MMSSKPEKLTLLRRRQIRSRFRGVVRTVILNKSFLADFQDYDSLSVKRRIAILTRREKKTGPLTGEEKLLFRKQPWTRTIEERKRLVQIVSKLRCFDIYPPKSRARITPHLDYMDVNTGRLVTREGDRPVYVYFVLAGELIARKRTFDTTKNEYYNKKIYILLAGDSVGDIAFMENQLKRQFSVEVSIDAELLCLDGDIFQKYLYPHLLKRWFNIKLAISKYDFYFGNWNYMQISFICRFGEIKEFLPMETIYHKDKGILNCVYFVVSGECMILQNLRTNVYRTADNKKFYELSNLNTNFEKEKENDKKLTNFDIIKAMKEIPKVASIDLIENFSIVSNNSMEENFFIDVGTLRYGAIFGLGETMVDRAIMARTTVQCLIIPRFWLLEREQNPGNIWQRLCANLNNAIPSREKLFKNFLHTHRWHAYKKDYINSLLKQNEFGNPTKADDIPLLCRIIETTYDDDD